MRACDFSKKEQKRVKKGKIFENLGKNVQNLKIFQQSVGDCMRFAIIACNKLLDKVLVCFILPFEGMETNNLKEP